MDSKCKKEFHFNFQSGSCPGGTITIGPGNAGELCNLHIKAGYHEISESSIDLNAETAKILIAYLKALIEIEKAKEDGQ